MPGARLMMVQPSRSLAISGARTGAHSFEHSPVHFETLGWSSPSHMYTEYRSLVTIRRPLVDGTTSNSGGTAGAGPMGLRTTPPSLDEPILVPPSTSPGRLSSTDV